MTLCLNPQCGNPQNQPQQLQCQACGSPLVLKTKYRCLRVLGQGGFGKTFLAVNESQSHKPRCVVKQFLAHAGHQPDRFRQEAKKLHLLGANPQIPHLIDYVEENNQTYLVQEFIQGETLEQRLTDQGILSPDEIFTLLIELLPVLHQIHQQQIIHRDIKPANLIKPRTGKICLVDFGASKTVTGTRLVQTGTIIGSACFTAPEQAIGKAIFASDIYSLGVTCIYLLTQVSPFTLYDISEGDWVWQDYLTQSVPASLSKILNKMLVSATKHRYSSCVDVLRDLQGPRTPIAPATKPRSIRSQPQSAEPKPVERKPVERKPVERKPVERKPVERKPVEPKPSPTLRQPSPAPVNPISKVPPTDTEKSPLLTVKLKFEVQTILKGHTKSINAVALSPDRRHIASAGADGYIRLWESGLGQSRKILMGGNAGSFDALDFSPDGELIAGAGWDGIIRIWQTVSGSEVCQLKAHEGMINTLQFSPDGTWLASGGYDGAIYIWKKQISQKFLWTHVLQFNSTHALVNPHEGWVTSLAFSPDSQSLVSVGWNGTAKIWNVETGKNTLTIDNDKVMMQAIAFHPDGQKIVTAGGNDRALTLWDAKTGQRIKTLAGKSYIFSQAGFMPNGQHLIAACSDGQLRVVNWKQGGCINRTVAHQKRINALAISRSGRMIVTGSADLTVKVWNLRKHV